MHLTLQQKRALITGGSRGIGAAIVKRLAREGAHVALTYVSKPDQANETVQAAQAFGVQALAIQADSADAQAVITAVESTVAEFGGLDILVNNAGIGVMASLDDYRLEDFDRTVAVNMRAVFVATQAAVKHMQAGGRIITIGSCNAKRMPFVGGAVYAMSKAALVGLVKDLARDLGPCGITINNVQPGSIGKSNGLFHRRGAPTLSPPTPRHRGHREPPSRSPVREAREAAWQAASRASSAQRAAQAAGSGSQAGGDSSNVTRRPAAGVFDAFHVSTCA